MNILKILFAVAVGSVLAACRNEKAASRHPESSSVYALITVDSKQLPANITHGDAALEVRSGTFTLNADGSCGTRTVFVPPTGTEVAREATATYTRDGSKLTMQWKGAGQTIGTIEGDTFSMSNEGIVFVYRK